MRLSVPTSPVSPRLWFAVAGAPLAWLFQFTVSYWLAEARCSVAGRSSDYAIDPWVIATGAASFAVGVFALATAVAIWRATSDTDDDDDPPLGRVHFLASIGIAVAPLFLAIIAMNSVGVGVLESCNQS
jgi:hypothetical protein